jgi:K+-sensing histidine kinase KdpD
MDLSRYNIFGQKEAALEAAKNNRRLINLRWWFMLLIFGVAAGTTYFTAPDSLRIQQYLLVLLFGLTVNGLFYAAVRLNPKNLRSQQFITLMQLVFDFAIIGMITYVQGGVMARTTALYVFPILAAALLFRGSMVLLVAAMSGATYVGAVLLEYYVTGRSISMEELVLPMTFYPCLFLLLARIDIYLELLKTNEVREHAYNSFLSLVGHQLKHPASAATTIIDVMSHDNKTVLSSDTKHYIELLKNENENQIRLIDNLLESAPHARQAAAMYYEEVDVAALVAKIAKRTAEANERSKDLVKLKDSASAAVIKASSIRLSLAFENVFDNAFRYSQAGDKVSYSVAQKAGKVVVMIRDSGNGMNETEVMRQLQRLSLEGIRGMESGGHVGGLGLGLYATSRIVQSYGGELDIHSSEEIGTTVIISLKREHA